LTDKNLKKDPCRERFLLITRDSGTHGRCRGGVAAV